MATSNDNQLFSFQGYVYLGELSGRKIANPFWVGDATMSIALETESVDHNESFSGQRLPYGRLTRRKNATATLTLFEAKADNLALALYGNKVPVTAEELPNTPAGGLENQDAGWALTRQPGHRSRYVICDLAAGEFWAR
jgi:hypothetical protein